MRINFGLSYGANIIRYNNRPSMGMFLLIIESPHEAPHGLNIFGQEKDNVTKALAKMNKILH